MSFSPVLYGDQLIFTSGRESNLVLQGENNWRKTGFYNIFSTKFKGKDSSVFKVEVPSLFSKQLANNNHTGPVCFEGDSIIFFTQLTARVKRQKEIRNPQLYIATKVDNKWENIAMLPFCQSDYAFGHPSWDSQKRYLYYSSNMPGGKGGKRYLSRALQRIR